MSETSTKPYLLRALYEWCTDNGYTPHLAVLVDARTRVPREFVRNGEIVLNISFTATSQLKMENDFIHFNARFGGVSRDIMIPVENVAAIYASENGQGMAFDVARENVDADHTEQAPSVANPPTLAAVPSTEMESAAVVVAPDSEDEPDPPKKGGKPVLTRIK